MNTVKVKIGEIFEVEGKLYVIALPTSSTDEVNGNGQIVLCLKQI